jgi:hypothetical protein
LGGLQFDFAVVRVRQGVRVERRFYFHRGFESECCVYLFPFVVFNVYAPGQLESGREDRKQCTYR